MSNILTSHVGSLPRSKELSEFLFAKDKHYAVKDQISIMENNGSRPVLIEDANTSLLPNTREEIKEVRAGDIAAAVGLKNVTADDTIFEANPMGT